MGKSIVGILAGRGFEVHVTSRSERKSGNANVTFIRGNAKDTAFLGTVLRQRRYDAIVDFMSYTTGQFRERYELFLEPTGQYVFLSSARVYAGSSAPLTEESPRLLEVCEDADYLRTDEYALAKARQEDMLNGSGRKNYTIIRPSLTYNDNRLQLVVSEKEEWLYRAMRGRSVILPKDIMCVRNSMAWGGDVAGAMARLVLNRKAYGETVQIASEEALTWAEAFDIYQSVLRRRLGREMRVIYMPDALELARKLDRYYQIKYARAVNRTFDCRKLRSIIGYDLRFVSPAEGLRRCLNAFLDSPRFSAISPHPHAFFDRIAGERTSLKEFDGTKTRLTYQIERYTGLDVAHIKAKLCKIT